MVIRGNRNRKLIENLPETASGFIHQYFFVKCPAGFFQTWRVGAVPTAFKSAEIAATCERLKALGKTERSIKILLKNENLHEFGLLDPNRTISGVRDAPAGGIAIPRSPTPSEEQTPLTSTEELQLKKCSSTTEGEGSKKALSPIEEGEEAAEAARQKEIAEKETAEVPARTEGLDSEQTLTDPSRAEEHVGPSDSEIFGNLSNLAVTERELFPEQSSQHSSPPRHSAIEVSSSRTTTPQARELVTSSKPATISHKKSGS